MEARADKIVSAICTGGHSWDELLVLLTGDIAYSGAAPEYAIATQFIDSLRQALKLRRPDVSPTFFAVPGNHDCDHTGSDTAIRDLVLDGLSRTPTTTLDPSPLKLLLASQQHFVSFRQKLQGSLAPNTDLEQVVQVCDLPIRNRTIRLLMLNTSLACRRRPSGQTDQGHLFLPTTSFPRHSAAIDTYSITMLHHPLNWLESNNGVEVRHFLASSADLVLTGHQHEEDAASSDWLSKDKNLWVSAAALQDSTGSSSGFNLIELDFVGLSETVTQYNWVMDLYVSTNARSWAKEAGFHANRRLVPMELQWLKTLDDPGTGFTHPSKQALRLRDIYVQPFLLPLIGSKASTSNHREVLREDEFIESLIGSDLTLVVGEGRSGKTTLLRTTTRYLYDSDNTVTCLVLKGSTLDHTHLVPTRLWRLISKEFAIQYESSSFARFEQLSPAERVLIIDDWHQVGLNENSRAELIDLLMHSFARVLLLSDDTTKLDTINSYTTRFSKKGTFSAYRLTPFGHYLRSQLIRKWVSFGQERTVGAEELNRLVKHAEATLNVVLGTSLLPAYPFFLLTLLQVSQNVAVGQHANGSYGYLYESLITMSLAEVSKETTEVDVYYTVLARIAWHFHERGIRSCNAAALNRVLQDYSALYLTTVDVSATVNNLIKARIISYNDSEYRFRYKYIYYYFLARYLAGELKASDTAADARATMLGFCDSVTTEESANAIIFLIYLTRDAELIGKLILSANGLFPDVAAFDADEGVGYLSPEVKRVQARRLLVEGSPESNQDRERHSLDMAASATQEEDDEVDVSGPNSDFARAIKLMDILGQIVRNFPGSTPGAQKTLITATVYKLGLRLMSVVIDSLQQHNDDFRELLALAVRSRMEDPSKLSEDELVKRVDRLLIVFLEVVVFGFVKAITSAVGIRQLTPIYDQIREQLPATPALYLIDLSVSLDHGESFPRDKILSLKSKLLDKWFASIILRRLVWHHLRMFHVDRNVARSVSKQLDIEIAERDLLGKKQA